MRLPDSAHTSRPWRIHEIAPDFDLEDVWALPTPGAAGDFPLLVEGTVALDPSQGSSRVARTLFAAREKLGELLGWDEPRAGLDGRVPSLRDRLPADLRSGPTGPAFETLPARPVYMTDNEFAAEIANSTVHGVVHLGWVEERPDAYRGQLAVLVKRNGLLGAAYVAAIKPFRYVFVYPALLRDVERDWRLRTKSA